MPVGREQPWYPRNRSYVTRDYEVVEAEPLGSILRRWITLYLKDRPLNNESVTERGDEYRRDAVFFGPIEWLSYQSGIHIRRTSEICNSKLKHVTFMDADALLTAIDGDHLLRDGTVPILKNPVLSQEEYYELVAERGDCI